MTKPEIEKPLPHIQTNQRMKTSETIPAPASATGDGSVGLFEGGDAVEASKESAEKPGEPKSE